MIPRLAVPAMSSLAEPLGAPLGPEPPVLWVCAARKFVAICEWP